MNYKEALKFIEESHKFGMRLGLENSFKLLELLGNPQDKVKIVHIAGTNGKGSVCSFISNTLISQGYKVGLYTSPYLETFTERIRLDGQNIPEEDVARIVTIMKYKIEEMVKEGYAYPTEFEIETAMAFYYYYEQKADYVVLEVGLGGRYDATNVVKSPLVSVIVSLSLDHIGVLGDTLGKIAYEKAGIIKKNSIAVVYKQKQEAEDVIKEVCKEKNTKYMEADFNKMVLKKSDINSQVFDCNILGEDMEDMEIKLIGEHQVNNAVLALTVIKVLKNERNVEISEEAIRNGFLNTKWPGRIEKIKDKPTFIIDGAHNEDGARSLTKALDKHFNGKKMTLLIGMLKDKDIDSVLELLMDKFDKVITTTPDSDRSMNCEELKEKIEKYVDGVIAIENIEDAVKYTLDNAKEDDVIISAGSLYMIGAVRKLVK
ncbi:MAG: folylpolyglutamate synthase/dihydrofolate synthase family protein [Terrisporobacter sp.]|uniref:bifunctional folylpolyglutamate synthase/dihydrofolate synthase n=1 Tax=Terrisporobacter sp. TaxID=1965305 RepID=UPI002FCB5DFB